MAGTVYKLVIGESGESCAFSIAKRLGMPDSMLKTASIASKFKLGDSVTVYPDKKIGIVCKTADSKGIVGVQLKGKKITVNHKRLKLLVSATELYPDDYDFSIIFDSVENRKLRHDMSRKNIDEVITLEDPKFDLK